MEPRQQELYSSVLSPEAGEWGKTSISDEWVMPSNFSLHLYNEEGGHFRTGLLETEPLQEVDEDMVSEVDLNSSVTDEEREEMNNELVKLEEEISTLRQVLDSKEKRHLELKLKLGITPLSELRQNFNRSWTDMQSSTVDMDDIYKKTSETLTTAGQKTSAAFTNLGSSISRRFGDMSSSIRHSMSMPAMRNSQSFRSFEEKMESTVTTIKTKVGTGAGGGGGNFEEVLSSAANASSQDTPTNNLTESTERPC
ncbi:tumor protein D53 isoform X3 [Clupea harengus]|uniref:Tumor protein D53 isoform X3 n=1 Tax=Clupea harengus TaxID=7950 RepID=A0A6P8GIJ4_CLUHA|nr:tumor protein D53 isoform X3 [Clupea harengus]